MSYKIQDDGSIVYSEAPDDKERERAVKAAARKMDRERGVKVVEDDDDKDHKSHPRTKAAKSSVPRETGTKVVEDTKLPPKPV